MEAFSLFGTMEVVYDGRASSVLELGNYLVLCKPDMCLAVHGGNFVKPLNYQNPGSEIRLLRSGREFDDLWANLFQRRPKLIIRAANRGESLTIAIYHTISTSTLPGWSAAKVNLTKSERDLVNQIINRSADYFPDIDAILIDTEIPTPYGNIDILLLDRAGIRHIVEVKRKVAGIAAVSQISRYGSYFASRGVTTKQYVAAPTISKNATVYANAHGQTWIKATFDD